jgi:hypothetical protein
MRERLALWLAGAGCFWGLAAASLIDSDIGDRLIKESIRTRFLFRVLPHSEEHARRIYPELF